MRQRVEGWAELTYDRRVTFPSPLTRLFGLTKFLAGFVCARGFLIQTTRARATEWCITPGGSIWSGLIPPVVSGFGIPGSRTHENHVPSFSI